LKTYITADLLFTCGLRLLLPIHASEFVLDTGARTTVVLGLGGESHVGDLRNFDANVDVRVGIDTTGSAAAAFMPQACTDLAIPNGEPCLDGIR
jgi:hypothetical protein